MPPLGQMLAVGRKQGPALCCWIRLQGEACCAGFGAVESSEFSWEQQRLAAASGGKCFWRVAIIGSTDQ